MIRKYAEIFCWKNVSSFCTAKATHIFSAKNIRILYVESAKTVNEMTLNKLVKLTMLLTTGSRRECSRKTTLTLSDFYPHNFLQNVGDTVNVSVHLPIWLLLYLLLHQQRDFNQICCIPSTCAWITQHNNDFCPRFWGPKGQISALTVCTLSPFTALSTCFYQVPTTYISMEKWRKLSKNYHQILLKSSGRGQKVKSWYNFCFAKSQRLRHRAAIKNCHLDTIFFLLLYHFLDHWLDLPNL